MRPLAAAVILIALIFSCNNEEKPVSSANLSSYQWIIGNWEMMDGKTKITESWSQVDDSTFGGSSSAIDSSGTIVFSERIGLRMRNGVAFYTATVEGQNNGKAVDFKITESDSTHFVAENPQHDFPKRIIYRQSKANELYAAVEGDTPEGLKREEFVMKKK